MKQRYTVRVRRGFALILDYLNEDQEHDVTDPQHPLPRRFKRTGRIDICSAVLWMRQNEMRDKKPDQPSRT